jgi:5-methyltetrahydropteroyltriglutamate--homocysteine methyltransferase
LESIPEERVRYNICWGSWHGPHTSDVPLRTIVNIILKASAMAYSIEAANPRHEHEFQVWQDVELPPGKVLVPGVITHRTPVVEHPEVVALRILRYTNSVAARTSSPAWTAVFRQARARNASIRRLCGPSCALVEGARLATQTLWP